jgi:hypothetical protein
MESEIGANESVSTAVVRAVSAVEGREPRTLRPLTDVLNPDALDNLFDSRSNGEPRTGGRLSFIYSNCRVTIDNGEYLTLQLLENHQRPSQSFENSSRAPSEQELSDKNQD